VPHAQILAPSPHDTVWFASFGGHKIGKLDPKTGQIKMYQPPTERAAPYSFVEDTRRGVLWFGDLNGNNLTRFDPRTETFVEYPFPSRNVNPRLGIGIDPRGRIWFTEFLNGRIGALDPGDSPGTTNTSR
jgi:virginiamycin B lyase